jgi:hypothetical protein
MPGDDLKFGHETSIGLWATRPTQHPESLVRAVLAWQADTMLGLHRTPPLGDLDSFAALRDRGDLRRDAEPEQLADVLMAAFQGGMLLAQATRDRAPLRNALDGAISYIETFRPRRRT